MTRAETCAAATSAFCDISSIWAAEQRFGIRFRSVEIECLRNVGEFIQLNHSKRPSVRRQ